MSTQCKFDQSYVTLRTVYNLTLLMNWSFDIKSNNRSTKYAFSYQKRYLKELIFRYKSLIPLLFHLMCRGQRLGLDVPLVDRELGLKATSLYLVLLAIPGSSAFKIFHPVLFNKALDSFKLALKLHLLTAASKKKPIRKRSSQSSQAKKGRRRRPSSPSSNVSLPSWFFFRTLSWPILFNRWSWNLKTIHKHMARILKHILSFSFKKFMSFSACLGPLWSKFLNP